MLYNSAGRSFCRGRGKFRKRENIGGVYVKGKVEQTERAWEQWKNVCV